MTNVSDTQNLNRNIGIAMLIFVILAAIYSIYAYNVQGRTYSAKVYYDEMQRVSEQIESSSDSPSLKQRQQLLLSLHRLRAGGDVQTQKGESVLVLPIQDYMQGDRTSISKVLDAVSNSEISRASSIMQAITNKFEQVQNSMVSQMMRLPFLMLGGIILFCLFLRFQIKRDTRSILDENTHAANQIQAQSLLTSHDVFVVDRDLNVDFSLISSLDSIFLLKSKDQPNLINLFKSLANHEVAAQVEKYLRSVFQDSPHSIANDKLSPLSIVKIAANPQTGIDEDKYYRFDLSWESRFGSNKAIKGVIQDITDHVRSELELQTVKRKFKAHQSILGSVLKFGEAKISKFLKEAFAELSTLSRMFPKDSKSVKHLSNVQLDILMEMAGKNSELAGQYCLEDIALHFNKVAEFAQLVKDNGIAPNRFQKLRSQLDLCLIDLDSSMQSISLEKEIVTGSQSGPLHQGSNALKTALVEAVQMCQRQSGCNIKLSLIGVEGVSISNEKIRELKLASFMILRQRILCGLDTKQQDHGDFPTEINVFIEVGESDGQVTMKLKDDIVGFSVKRIRGQLLRLGLVSKQDIPSLKHKAIMDLVFSPKFYFSQHGDALNGLYLAAHSIMRSSGRVVAETLDGRLAQINISIPK